VTEAATAPASRRSARRAESASVRDTPTAEVAWSAIEGRPTLAEQVYTAVRERILAGQLAPSTALRPRDVEQMMRVSRTPVREALQRLSSEGFLEPAPRQGFRVPDLSIDDLVDLYPAVQLLEVLAFDLAIAKIQPPDLDALERINAEFASAVSAGDVTAAVDANTRFHEGLAAVCGNRPLCRLLEDLRLRVRRLEMLDFGQLLLTSSRRDGRSPRRDLWVRQHADMITAMRRGQFAAARELLRRNRSLLPEERTRGGRARPEASAAAATSPASSGPRRSAAAPAATRRRTGS
jgi:DNA-binding GntR family transcriptional regulator